MQQTEVTLFYSDVSGFTALTERLGDSAAFEVIQRHVALLRELATAHGGREIELRGDASLLAFESADACFACAVAVHVALAEERRVDPARGLSLRIGLHTGRPIPHPDGYFGRDVIIAARLADACPPNAILASRSFRRRLRDPRRVGRERSLLLKGLAEPEPVARIYWGAREGRRRLESTPIHALLTAMHRRMSATHTGSKNRTSRTSTGPQREWGNRTAISIAPARPSTRTRL